MPKLISYSICDGIQNIPVANGSIVPQLVAPTLALRPQSLPSNFSFGLSIGLRDINTNVQNTLQVIIESPSGTLAYDSTPTIIPPAPEDSSLPACFRGIVMAVDLRNIFLSEAGCYSVKILVNGELVSTQELPVFLRK